MKMAKFGMFWGLVLIFGNFLILPAMGQPPENWKEGIAYDVVPSAKITKVSFSVGNTEVGAVVFYEVGIQNVTETARRFKLTIYPLDGDPVAILYPLTARKGKPLALEAKEEMILKCPVLGKEMPKGFALVVKDMED